MSNLIAYSTVFSILITKLVDLCRNTFDNPENPNLALKKVWNLLAVGLGAVFAILFNLNVFLDLPIPRLHGVLGQLLTGLGMGATGSGWHEILDAISGAAKNAHETAELKELEKTSRLEARQ